MNQNLLFVIDAENNLQMLEKKASTLTLFVNRKTLIDQLGKFKYIILKRVFPTIIEHFDSNHLAIGGI